MPLAQMVGWFGAFGVLGAHALLTLGRWPSTSLRYQGANVVCGGSLLIWAVSVAAWQGAIVNALWAALGVIGFSKSWRSRNADSNAAHRATSQQSGVRADDH